MRWLFTENTSGKNCAVWRSRYTNTHNVYSIQLQTPSNTFIPYPLSCATFLFVCHPRVPCRLCLWWSLMFQTQIGATCSSQSKNPWGWKFESSHRSGRKLPIRSGMSWTGPRPIWKRMCAHCDNDPVVFTAPVVTTTTIWFFWHEDLNCNTVHLCSEPFNDVESSAKLNDLRSHSYPSQPFHVVGC